MSREDKNESTYLIKLLMTSHSGFMITWSVLGQPSEKVQRGRLSHV